MGSTKQHPHISIKKGDGPNIHITTNGSDSLGGDADNPSRTDKPFTETLPGKDLKELEIKSYVTDWKVVESADDQAMKSFGEAFLIFMLNFALRSKMEPA